MRRLRWPLQVVRCDADGCRETQRLIFVAAVARTPAGDDDVGLRICPLHAKLHMNGMHVALRSAQPNPHGMIALIAPGTPRIGILDADGDEVIV